MKKKFTKRQQKFIDAYAGDAKEASKICELNYDYCRQLLTKPHIVLAIQERSEVERLPTIATRQERQAFWTNVYRDPKASMPDRLRASELLGKSEKDFVERVEVAGKDGGPVESEIKVFFVRPGDIKK